MRLHSRAAAPQPRSYPHVSACAVRAHRWGSGFVREPLGLLEPALSFEPWRLVVAGDYLGTQGNSAEAALLSGLEAANRVSQWLGTNT